MVHQCGGNTTKKNLLQIFTLQKQAVRILAKLNYGETCKGIFRQLKILTLPAIFIRDSIMFVKEKELCKRSQIHSYDTRAKDDLFQESYRGLFVR